MRVHQESIELRTRGRDFANVTEPLSALVSRSGIDSGTCNVFIQHTSASLLVQENADPRVLSDLQAWMSELAPEHRAWEHDDEGPDDMPAHARSALTLTSLTVPIRAGRLALGTWQAVYVWEHRTRPHARKLLVTLIGE